MQGLYQGLSRPRGPSEAPCSTTSTAHSFSTAGSSRLRQWRSQHHGRPRRVPFASISSNAPGVVGSMPAQMSKATTLRVVTVPYDEETEDDVFIPAPPGGKTLKINVDLMLWRSRQSRLKAQLCTDEEERRSLLKESEAGLRRCLVLDPADPRTYVVLGKLLMIQKRFDEARALYAEGVSNTGNMNAYIWSAWGWLEFKTGNIARARQLFDAATVVDDTHACAWHKWGLLEKSEGNYLRARDLWMKGIQRCRRKQQASNAYLYNALAVMAAELKRVAEARAWFDEGTSTVEGVASVALWQAWAVLEAEQGDVKAVRYLFKKALQANPKSRYVHLAWGLFERKCGNLRTCVELLLRGQQFNPTDAALYQARALIQWQDLNKPENARALFRAGVRADASHLPLWQAWGCMEAALGNVTQARELFQQGVWADPRSRDTVWVLHAWGCLERNQGDLQLARELFKAAVKVDPKAEKVWFTWIAMEADAGYFERAEELRIRSAEQAWEFEVPAGFTTRPGGSAAGGTAGAGDAGISNPLAALRDTLSQFFSARRSPPGSSQTTVGTGSQTPGMTGADGVASFLPADFSGEVSLDDLLASTRSQAQAAAAAASAATASAVSQQQAAPAAQRQDDENAQMAASAANSSKAPQQPAASAGSGTAAAAASSNGTSHSQPQPPSDGEDSGGEGEEQQPGAQLTDEQAKRLLSEAAAMMTAFARRPSGQQPGSQPQQPGKSGSSNVPELKRPPMRETVN